jgi:tetratricopeptide (TPR) repeat protein
MARFPHNSNSRCAPLLATALALFALPVFSQSPAPQTPSSAAPKQHNSGSASANLAAEQAEDAKLNDAYQTLYLSLRNSNCGADALKSYQSDFLPRAAKAKSKLARNKYLYLANRDIGNCHIAQQNFAAAEASFQENMEYAAVWPGTEDSAYPINVRQIGSAQMGQQHWPEAEKSLQKSIAIFDSQIAAAEKSDPEFMRAAHLSNLRASESESYALLAIVYFRQVRLPEALQTIDQAYDQVTKFYLPANILNNVIKIGKGIADVSNDPAAKSTWEQRASAIAPDSAPDSNPATPPAP